MHGLITHECSGRVRDAFNAMPFCIFRSCDLKPANDGEKDFHIQGDAIEAMNSRRWDFIGMHPDCTFLTVSGLHWNGRIKGRKKKTEAATRHVIACIETASRNAERWYMENPVSIISTFYRKPDQIIQPYEFGDDASKQTCLWLHNLPKLIIDPTKRKNGRMVEYKGKTFERWSNQTDSGQNRLPPSEHRAADRAQTYPGIAQAMAQQWGTL